MAGGSKILIIGGTGGLGKFVVEASHKAGHPTFALVRDLAPSDPTKASLLQSFQASGVTLLKGDLTDTESLVSALKQVDVVISVLGSMQIVHQLNLIAAIKAAGNIKRFIPSEFGMDVDRVHAVEPAKSHIFDAKVSIRRAIEKEGIPYTYVCCNFLAGYFLSNLSQPKEVTAPPRDKVVILGDGEPKLVFVKEEDVATYAIRTVDDPKTLNKILYLRPHANTLSFNQLVSLWEEKIGSKVEKIYVPEEQLLKMIQESPEPINYILAVVYPAYVKGDHTNFEIDASVGVEGTELYPDVEYITVDKFLDKFV